jgi:hypothetical protein
MLPATLFRGSEKTILTPKTLAESSLNFEKSHQGRLFIFGGIFSASIDQWQKKKL